jgi:hypothetical protein
VKLRSRPKPGPGGVDDGLPATPGGEPLLARWFAITMVGLVVAGVIVLILAFLAIPEPNVPPAERRPPGDALVTHERGDALLNEIRETEAGPGCASAVTLVGDESARATARRALSATCQLLRGGRFPAAEAGLGAWSRAGGAIRLGVFELTGVESSTRLEDEGIVMELNAKFQFKPAYRAAPVIIHELVHIGSGMPGVPVTVESELAAVEAQHLACQRLTFQDAPPRGCSDVAELLAEDDPAAALERAGYQREDAT